MAFCVIVFSTLVAGIFLATAYLAICFAAAKSSFGDNAFFLLKSAAVLTIAVLVSLLLALTCLWFWHFWGTFWRALLFLVWLEITVLPIVTVMILGTFGLILNYLELALVDGYPAEYANAARIADEYVRSEFS